MNFEWFLIKTEFIFSYSSNCFVLAIERGFVYCVELYKYVHKIQVHLSAYSVVTDTNFEVYGTTETDNFYPHLFRLDIQRFQLLL
jgi:hypothetical protein